MIKSYSTYTNIQMNYNMYEYNEVDLEQLCRLSTCSYVLYNDAGTFKALKAYHGSKGLWLNRDKNIEVTIKQIYDIYYIDNNYNILLSIKLE